MSYSKKVTNLKGEFKVAEIDIVYRNKIKASERPAVKVSSDAYKYFMATWNKDLLEMQEQFRVLFLDRNNCCIAISTPFTGGVTSVMVDLRLIFAEAVKIRAVGLIVAHNHPSGNNKPSMADKRLTMQISNAGKLMDVPLIDHLIVTKESYTSLSDEGFVSSY